MSAYTAPTSSAWASCLTISRPVASLDILASDEIKLPNIEDAIQLRVPLELSFYRHSERKVLTVVSAVETPSGRVNYAGEARIDGVPGTAAPISIVFKDTAGSTCGALLPTGNTVDEVEGVKVTLIDNGMPCVILDAADFGISGAETPQELDANTGLKAQLEAVRLAVGPMMKLGDVSKKSIPKMTLVSVPRAGGCIATRTFIPHQCHEAIGVLGAVSVASACLLEDGPAARYAVVPEGSEKVMSVEHPTGEFTVIAKLGEKGELLTAAVLRTARKLADGSAF